MLNADNQVVMLNSDNQVVMFRFATILSGIEKPLLSEFSDANYALHNNN